MKIAYLLINHSSKTLSGGVGKKVRTQVKRWGIAGNNVQVFILATDEFKAEDEYIITIKNSLPIIKEIYRIKSLITLLQAIVEFAPDVIYLRYGLYVFPLHRVFNFAPVIIELNTLDIFEYKYRGVFYYWYNRLLRNILLKRSSGFVTVTDEIATHISITKFNKSTIVIPNCVDLNDFSIVPKTNNKNPKVVFIGHPGYPWHGIDKIIKLSHLLPDIEFEVIGYSRNDLKSKSIDWPQNLHLHGFKMKEGYEDIFRKSDVGISSLALHRIPLKEGSTLKTREYLSFGLPLIIAHDDKAVEILGEQYVLKIPNTEDNMIATYNLIRDFVYAVRGNRVPRKQVELILDLEKTEKMRLEFFEKIYSDNNNL